MAREKRLKPNCPWQGCSSTDDPQQSLTDRQAAVLPASMMAKKDDLLRCSACGVVYEPEALSWRWEPRGFIVDDHGCKWITWQIGHHHRRDR
jgi:hypothetical protein